MTTPLPLPILLFATAAGVRAQAIARAFEVSAAEVRRELGQAPAEAAQARETARQLQVALAQVPRLTARRRGGYPAFTRRARPTLGADTSAWPGCARQSPEAFRSWFGQSQMVDACGAPRLVYHATDAEVDFDTFDRSEDIGFHVGSLTSATERLLALVRATAWRHEAGADLVAADDPCRTFGPRLVPAYLKMARPLRVPDLHTWEGKSVLWALEPYLTDSMIEEAESWDEFGVAEGRRLLELAGCDGIVYRNATERGGDSWMVADPCQIKSAVANDGGFRSDDPRLHR
jgi:hypothetical protein